GAFGCGAAALRAAGLPEAVVLAAAGALAAGLSSLLPDVAATVAASAVAGVSSTAALRGMTDTTPPRSRPVAITPASARGATQRSGLLARIDILLLGRCGGQRRRLGGGIQAVRGGGEGCRGGVERVALQIGRELGLRAR